MEKVTEITGEQINIAESSKIKYMEIGQGMKSAMQTTENLDIS